MPALYLQLGREPRQEIYGIDLPYFRVSPQTAEDDMNRRAFLVRMAERGTHLAGAALGVGAAGGCYSRWLPRYSEQGFSNVSHTRCVDPAAILNPRGLTELAQLVLGAEAAGARVRPVGTGHSYSDAAFTNGWIVKTDRMQRPIPLPPSRLHPAYRGERLVSVEAGMKLDALNQLLQSHSPPLALPSMGGWAEQSVAGVLATSTHGSGLGYGAYPSCVASLVLVASGGRVVQIEPSAGITDPAAFAGSVLTPDGPVPGELVQDDDAFYSALVSVGSMGITYAVVLRVTDAFWLREEREVTTWAAVTAKGGFLDSVIHQRQPTPAADGSLPDFYQVIAEPYAGPAEKSRVIIVRRSKIPLQDGPAVHCKRRGTILLSIAASYGRAHPDVLPAFFNSEPHLIPQTLHMALKSERTKCFEGRSYDVFNEGKVNLLRGFSVEVGVDLQDTVAAVERLRLSATNKLRTRTGVHSAPIALRFVKASDAYLSPQYGRDTTMIEIFALVGILGTDAVLQSAEVELMEAFGARPHWGLDLNALSSTAQVAALYPRFDTWNQQRQRWNASGVFDGEWTDRLGLSQRPDRLRDRSHVCVPL